MKRLITLLLVVALAIAMVGCTSTTQNSPNPSASASVSTSSVSASADKNASASTAPSTAAAGTKKIGLSVIDTGNVIFAEVSKQVQKMCDEKGYQLTILNAANDSGKQITQIENLITDKVDLIAVQAVDINSLSDVVAKAKAAGIKLAAWGVHYQGADVNMINPNYDAGYMVGKAAGEWLKKTYPDVTAPEVALFSYEAIKECADRKVGAIAGLAAANPGAKIVAEVQPLDLATGMSDAESILQAHPNVKAFMSYGDTPALGACEALESLKVDPKEYGIFSTDAAQEAIKKIAASTPFKMSVCLGNPTEMAGVAFNSWDAALSGNYAEYYYTPAYIVDGTNVQKYLAN